MQAQTQSSHCLSPSVFRQQNHQQRFGSRSQENRHVGFHPAFQDLSTGRTYLSRFADGSPAPFHLLDGLPTGLLTARTSKADGSPLITVLKTSVIVGFVRGQRFYTRAQAADATRYALAA